MCVAVEMRVCLCATCVFKQIVLLQHLVPLHPLLLNFTKETQAYAILRNIRNLHKTNY